MSQALTLKSNGWPYRGHNLSSEQIIVKLREAEVLESKGKGQLEIARSLGIAEQTLIRWRKEYGGLRAYAEPI
jgi:hypothetical protein